ncbi:hypothetical protein Salat_0670500 [Sesamum alatum]|uniref:Uncharacterized protein n=1 Tax=Sesamum alatum TaxID=300844 RepID=A0AAE1YRY0_9LAMI|nr:hypothetical protein Salat_0670500 [Sesamum alatum]
MEGDLLRLDSVLSLMEEEGLGVLIPQSEWKKGVGVIRLTLIGLLLYIGEFLGAWLDGDDNGRFISWFETVRIRTNSNVLVPLKRALRLHSELGDEEHFVDPGSKTPYGAWLRVSGPLRHLGFSLVSVRPTYIWCGSSGLGFSRMERLGAQIFGEFRRDSSQPEMVVGEPPVGEPSIQERLAEEQERLAVKRGKEKERIWVVGPPFDWPNPPLRIQWAFPFVQLRLFVKLLQAHLLLLNPGSLRLVVNWSFRGLSQVAAMASLMWGSKSPSSGVELPAFEGLVSGFLGCVPVADEVVAVVGAVADARASRVVCLCLSVVVQVGVPRSALLLILLL